MLGHLAFQRIEPDRVGPTRFQQPVALAHRPLVGRHLAGMTAIETIDQPVHEAPAGRHAFDEQRSEEHTSELQSLMRHSYAVFCLKKKNTKTIREIVTCVQT